MIHRRDELRASKIMQERAFADPKLEIVWDSEVAAIHGDDRLESITLRSTRDGSESELPVTGLFIAIGHDPRSELIKGQVDLDDDGYVAGLRTPRRRPTCPASSPAATWSTTTTGRRSPLPAPAAPRPSTPSATSPSSTTPPPARPRPRRPTCVGRRDTVRRRPLTRGATGEQPSAA